MPESVLLAGGGTAGHVNPLLAVADATGDAAWRDRAARIARFVVELSGQHDGRLPEHFGPDWVADLELNADRPGDQFKPYGATIGHGFEWARLLVHVESALGLAAPDDLLPAALTLFDRATADGWDADGAEVCSATATLVHRGGEA